MGCLTESGVAGVSLTGTLDLAAAFLSLLRHLVVSRASSCKYGTMIIGVSGGDIILGINLLRDSLQALSNTAGSQQQYLDAVHQLESLELCLKVAQCKLSDLESTDSHSILARAIFDCARCIDGYHKEIRKYEAYFCSERSQRFRHRCVREWRKIQWLHDKDKTEALSKTIASHVQIITLACSIGSLFVLCAQTL